MRSAQCRRALRASSARPRCFALDRLANRAESSPLANCHCSPLLSLCKSQLTEFSRAASAAALALAAGHRRHRRRRRRERRGDRRRWDGDILRCGVGVRVARGDDLRTRVETLGWIYSLEAYCLRSLVQTSKQLPVTRLCSSIKRAYTLESVSVPSAGEGRPPRSARRNKRAAPPWSRRAPAKGGATVSESQGRPGPGRTQPTTTQPTTTQRVAPPRPSIRICARRRGVILQSTAAHCNQQRRSHC